MFARIKGEGYKVAHHIQVQLMFPGGIWDLHVISAVKKIAILADRDQIIEGDSIIAIDTGGCTALMGSLDDQAVATDRLHQMASG